MCRIFKKTIQIPAKAKEEEQAEDVAKNSVGEDSSGTEISREVETVDHEKVVNHHHEHHPNKLIPPCDASSSDVTQGTCTPTDTCIVDDFQAQFACDEAISSAANNNSYIPMGLIGYPSNLFQVTFN